VSHTLRPTLPIASPASSVRRDCVRKELTRSLVVAVVVLAAAGSLLTATREHDDDRRGGPLITGHRGASGYLPEHTLEAYQLAIDQGADYIEPDLVSTRDGVLIARHEVNITGTTDVASRPEFAGRFTTKTIDGITESGWFADDFTLAEIRSLRAIQRLPFRPQQFNGRYRVPTFSEVVALAKRSRTHAGRMVGVYPETKHPTYHAFVGLPLERRLVDVLERYGLNRASAPVFIQSFEVTNLLALNRMTSVRLVQLVDANGVRLDGTIDSDNYGPYDLRSRGDMRTYADLVTPRGLAAIARYADGVGPWKRYIVGAAARDADGNGVADDANGDGSVDDADRTALPPTDLVDEAHDVGLLVHTWTFRNETRYLAGGYQDNPVEEYLQFYCLGIDGLFSDFPDTAVTARALLRLNPRLCRAD
jgi:glycerophosphoryl diester phosphodiesterase